MLKKVKIVLAGLCFLLTLGMFVDCASNPLSGHTYKATSMTNDGITVSMSGTTITRASPRVTIVIIKSGSSYTATRNGTNVTEEEELSFLSEMYEYESQRLNMTLTFNNGAFTASSPDTGLQTGTYTIDRNTATLEAEEDRASVTTTDSWGTFTMLVSDTTIVFTRQ